MKFADEKRLTELRKCLGDTVKTVWEDKEPVLIKSHDKAVAAIVPLDFLERVEEQQRRGGETALERFMASATDIDSSASFEHIKGHEQTQVSPDIELDLQQMQDEQSSEETALHWKAKCAELQEKIGDLCAQLENLQKGFRQPQVRVETGSVSEERFVDRHNRRLGAQVFRVKGDNVKIEMVAPATAVKLSK